jgi:Tol biopolymer transport system component
MSPEQARGQTVDKRTDIWAFGCVLFEMCAQQPPFAGATISDAQAALIEREPDWNMLRAGTPANLVRLLRRCLTKDQKLRLRDIGEARIALAHDADIATAAPRSTTRRAVAITAVLATAASLFIAFAVFGWPRPGPSASPPPNRLFVPPPEGTTFRLNPGYTFFALSPDGSKLAFVAGPDRASPSAGKSRLWLRHMDDDVTRPIEGTEGASSAFWSPDSQSLAFFAGAKLNRIDLPGGPVVPICAAGMYGHGSWGANGVILLGRLNGKSIDAVSAAGGGGDPVQVVTRNQSQGETRVHWPWFLPDGKRFLYTARLDDGEGEVRLARLRLDDREGTAPPVPAEEDTRTIIKESSNAQWVGKDTVVFVRDGALMAQRVDEAWRLLGKPFMIAKRVEYFLTSSRAMFSTSQTGSVAYHSGQDIGQLVWADGTGEEIVTIGGYSEYQPVSARLSQDESALLVARRREGLGTFDIWRLNLNVSPVTEKQLTFDRGSEITPIFINDGRDIVFAGDSPGSLPHLFRKDLATGKQEWVLPPGYQQTAQDFSSSGRTVIYSERGSEESAAFRLFEVPLDGSVSGMPLLQDYKLGVTNARLSPVNDRVMTFATNDGAGQIDVYVATRPVTSPKKVADKVSGPARWSRDGNRIYFIRDEAMMTATVSTVPSLTVGKPEKLFDLRRTASLQDVSRDGRFLLLVSHVRAGMHPITVDLDTLASTRQ